MRQWKYKATELNHSELTLTQTEGTVDTQIHVS